MKYLFIILILFCSNLYGQATKITYRGDTVFYVTGSHTIDTVINKHIDVYKGYQPVLWKAGSWQGKPIITYRVISVAETKEGKMRTVMYMDKDSNMTVIDSLTTIKVLLGIVLRDSKKLQLFYQKYGDIKEPQQIDSTKYYYHTFLYFNNKLNDPKLSIKKFEMIEDSAKRYLDLLNRKRK